MYIIFMFINTFESSSSLAVLNGVSNRLSYARYLNVFFFFCNLIYRVVKTNIEKPSEHNDTKFDVRVALLVTVRSLRI